VKLEALKIITSEIPTDRVSGRIYQVCILHIFSDWYHGTDSLDNLKRNQVSQCFNNTY